MPPSSERQLGNEPARADIAQTLDLVLVADWISPSVARDQVRAWLKANRWSPAQTDDLVLAINEAVSNSIEHGYQIGPDDPPNAETVAVNGRIVQGHDGSRHVELIIRDTGTWHPPVEGAPTTRGHGVRLMRACVDHLTIDGASTGTTVTMHSRPVPV